MAEDADALVKKAEKLMKPSMMKMRFKPEWDKAEPLFKKASAAYRANGELQKAQEALEQASRCQEMLGSPYQAAKILEDAAHVAKERGDPGGASRLYLCAADLYVEVGRFMTAGAAASEAAAATAATDVAEADKYYARAVKYYEQDNKQLQAADVYHKAAAMHINAKNWVEAQVWCLQYASIAQDGGVIHSAHKAQLSAVIILLAAGDAQGAWMAYQDCMESSSTFANSDEAKLAEGLFNAYKEGDAAGVAAYVKKKHAFTFLETYAAKLAKSLPGADNISGLAATLRIEMGEPGGMVAADEEEEGEEDLT